MNTAITITLIICLTILGICGVAFLADCCKAKFEKYKKEGEK